MAERETNSFGLIRELRNVSIFSTEHIQYRTPNFPTLTPALSHPMGEGKLFLRWAKSHRLFLTKTSVRIS